MRSAILVALILSLGGCVIQRTEQAAQAKQQLVGMTPAQIVMCMGPPHQKVTEAGIEVWSYQSGGAVNSYGNSLGGDGYRASSGTSEVRDCTINLLFDSGSVSKVQYLGNTGGLLSKGEQCAYIVSGCVK